MIHFVHAALNTDKEPARVEWLMAQRKAGINPTDTVRGLIDRAIAAEKPETEQENARYGN